MKISLDRIKSSPHQVRESWDEGKMNGLAQSIKEQGVIVPVKVRPSDGEYELVYGHRRVEAAKRAGLTEVPAIVEGLEDETAIVQALIENIQREDLQPIEEAKAYRVTIGHTGWSIRELGRHSGINYQRITRHLALLDETDEVQSLLKRSGSVVTDGVTEGHVREVRISLGDDRETKEQVIKKAASEGLTMKQTRQVADAVKEAPDEDARHALLDTPVEDDPDLWEAAAHIKAREKKQVRKERHEMAPAVKELVGDVKRTRRIFQRGKDSMRIGKMGPEHMPYIATQLRDFARWLIEWADELDRVREELVNGQS